MLTTAPLAVAVIGLCLVVAFVLLLLCCAKRMSCVAELRYHIKITVEPLWCHATARCFPVLLCAIMCNLCFRWLSPGVQAWYERARWILTKRTDQTNRQTKTSTKDNTNQPSLDLWYFWVVFYRFQVDPFPLYLLPCVGCPYGHCAFFSRLSAKHRRASLSCALDAEDDLEVWKERNWRHWNLIEAIGIRLVASRVVYTPYPMKLSWENAGRQSFPTGICCQLDMLHHQPANHSVIIDCSEL